MRRTNGQQERLCNGPSHEEPAWLPDTDKYFYTKKKGRQAGQRVSQCRLCNAWIHGTEPGLAGLVPLAPVKPFFIEGVNKVGKVEFARRIGISRRALLNILTSPQRNVKKSTARRAMLEVISIRRKGEVRHKDSINYGASARGRPERQVTSPDDLYQPRGDDYQERLDREAEQKRNKRASLPSDQLEEFRKKDRERRRKPQLTSTH